MNWWLAAPLLALSLGVGVVGWDQYRRYADYNAPLPMTVPKQLPKCADIDWLVADLRLMYASANLSGYNAEAEMWMRVIEEELAKPCIGPRWEIEQ